MPAREPDRGTNGFAIAALVLGILGIVLISVPFAIVALVQIPRRHQRGRGLAVGGLAVSGFWILVLVVVAVVVGVMIDDHVPLADARVGDCVADLTESTRLFTLPVVPCEEPHIGEVYALFDLSLEEWPGEDVVFAEAEEGCVNELAAYSMTAYNDVTVEIYYVHPTQATWRRGDREVICVTDYQDGPRTGPLRDG